MSFIQFYLGFVLLGLRFSYHVSAQNVQFGQVMNLNGDMNLNTLTFPDNSKIETFSQTQRQILVNQNPPPVPASHIMGSTGQPFVQLSQNSMTISTNGATDLVGAQIELPINPMMLQQSGVTPENTFVAMLSPNRQAWIIMEGVKSVNTTDNTVRMVKLNSIDGEYLAVGRQTTETSNVLSPFGSSPQQAVNITGSGIQEVEYQDGFRMSIMATKPMTVNVNVANGVSTSMTSSLMGAMSVNNYRYRVNTNLAGVVTSLNQMMAVVQLPLNANRLMAMAQSMGAGPNDTISLGISQRSVIQNPGGSSLQKRQKKAASSSSSSKSLTSSSPVAEATPETTPSSSPDAESTDSTTMDAAPDVSAASDPAVSEAAASSPPAADSAPAAAMTPPPSTTIPQGPAAPQLLLSPTFTPITARTVLDMTNGRVAVTVKQLDGEFIVTMSKAGAQNQVQANPGTLSTFGQSSQNNALGTDGLILSEKRQISPSQNGLLVSMEQLKSLAQQQKNGGMLPVLSMMNEMMEESQGLFKRKRAGPARMQYV